MHNPAASYDYGNRYYLGLVDHFDAFVEGFDLIDEVAELGYKRAEHHADAWFGSYLDPSDPPAGIRCLGWSGPAAPCEPTDLDEYVF